MLLGGSDFFEELDVMMMAITTLVIALCPTYQQIGGAAAMRGESGAIYLGLHIGSKRINVCAESSALANARIAQEASIESSVAVSMDQHGEPQVTNPCGVCRELLRNYGAEATVLVDAGGEVGTVSLGELLPYPWTRATETEWTTHPPEAMKTY